MEHNSTLAAKWTENWSGRL